MKFFKPTAAMLATGFLTLGLAIPALAVTNGGAGTATPYVAAFAPIFGNSGAPHSGEMRLFVRDGIITGTYTGTSVRPDYFDDRIVPVTGNVSSTNGYVTLLIGGMLSLHGTMDGNGTITGTAFDDGRFYEFMAEPSR
jgi:hypothetical protein